jgi:glycosyltransferase involved in cell wall biosynthesis
VTCTEANRRHLLAIAPGATVHRIYHGLNADFTRLAEPGAPAPARNGALRVLGVGRLVPKKGFDVLVDACALLHRQGLPVEVRLVGEDGEHGDELRRRIAAHGLEERVRLDGVMSQRELYDAYRASSALCLPCRVTDNGDRDGIPNVLVEAMACAVPVVTTPVSGIPELVVDGRNGLLVPPGDAPALAAALVRLHGSRDLAESLGDEGRRTVRERFDGDRLVGQLADLFREALA